MSARNCPECGGLVASTISVCPHCGHHLEEDGNSARVNVNRNLGPNPYNSLFWSIVSLITFWPFGVVSLIYYFKSDSCWNNGNAAGAEEYGATSVRWGKAIFWIYFIFFIFLLLGALLDAVIG